jgi:hypothetical protein
MRIGRRSVRFSEAALGELLEKWMKYPLRHLEIMIEGKSTSCVYLDFNVNDQPLMGQRQQTYYIGGMRCSPGTLKRIVEIIASRELTTSADSDQSG